MAALSQINSTLLRGATMDMHEEFEELRATAIEVFSNRLTAVAQAKTPEQMHLAFEGMEDLVRMMRAQVPTRRSADLNGVVSRLEEAGARMGHLRRSNPSMPVPSLDALPEGARAFRRAGDSLSGTKR